MFKLEIDNFETLVDLEVALDSEIDTLGNYRHLSEREAEALSNLSWIRNQVKAIRKPITEAIRKGNK